jgi:hypothetical protein
MNNFLIIFIILFIIGIVLFLITISNKKIEHFNEVISNLPFPNIANDNDVNIQSQDLSNMNSSANNITLNIRESLDISTTYESFIITSSYLLTNRTDTISSLFKLHPPTNGIKLTSVEPYDQNGNNNINSGFGDPVRFYNYISINFPNTNMTATKIEISYSTFEISNKIKSDISTDIRIYTSEDNTFQNLGTQNINKSSDTLVFNIPENKLIKSYLYIFISPKIRSIVLTKLRFFIQKKEYLQKVITEDDIIKFSTDNPAEQITIPSTFSAGIQEETEIGFGQSISNYKKLNNLFKFISPWAIYDGKDYNVSSGTIPEILKRNCKDAKVSGAIPQIITENNIKYLSGTTATKIIFPDFSLPEYYTICAITKYTSSDRSNLSKRGRILSCVNSAANDWILGHWWNKVGVMHYNGWKTPNEQSISGDGNQWVVSCVKSSSSVDKSLLFNGISRGTSVPPKMNNNSANNKISINNNNIYVENSDFGLSYLIIWDVVLTDNQLKLVSDTLQEYLKTGQDLDLSDITISQNDGSTEQKAAKSAIDIKRLTCTNTNGPYWIKYATNKPAKLVYCIMDSMVFGGGWMLALKGAKNSPEFVYRSHHWTNNTVLNETENNFVDFTNAKYDIYNYYPATDCLAIFDANDTAGELTFNNYPEYGWIWHIPNIIGNVKITLLDFFKPRTGFQRGLSSYAYTSSNQGNIAWVKQWMINRGFTGFYISPQYFEERFVKVTCIEKSPLNRKIFSQQEHFKAWGLNVIPHAWAHAVRWGGSFNENPGHWDGLPGSNDVSCGIGLEAKNYSAGDAITCCQSTKGTNASMGFKWFIR